MRLCHKIMRTQFSHKFMRHILIKLWECFLQKLYFLAVSYRYETAKVLTPLWDIFGLRKFFKQSLIRLWDIRLHCLWTFILLLLNQNKSDCSKLFSKPRNQTLVDPFFLEPLSRLIYHPTGTTPFPCTLPQSGLISLTVRCKFWLSPFKSHLSPYLIKCNF